MRVDVLAVVAHVAALWPVVAVLPGRHVDAESTEGGVSHILGLSRQRPSRRQADAADHESARDARCHFQLRRMQPGLTRPTRSGQHPLLDGVVHWLSPNRAETAYDRLEIVDIIVHVL